MHVFNLLFPVEVDGKYDYDFIGLNITAPSKSQTITYFFISLDSPGISWTNTTGWAGAVGTECDWYGVTCSGGNLTGLNLASNNLVGTIPSELGNLTILKRLNLSFNRLTGSIPPQLGNLTSISTLYLNNNELTGSIPPELPHAQYLDLWNNQLTGAIPTELQGSYMMLNLKNNQLSGSIPPGIIKMSEEATIEVSGNPKLDRNVLIKLYDSTKLSVTINDPDNRIQFESFYDEYTQPISTLDFNKVNYSVG
jgi:Leucine-rich repeat (LRR) protein